MQELRALDTDVLVDLLAAYTSDYIRLAEDPSKYDEFAKCYLNIKTIQEEIESRRRGGRGRMGRDPSS